MTKALRRLSRQIGLCLTQATKKMHSRKYIFLSTFFFFIVFLGNTGKVIATDLVWHEWSTDAQIMGGKTTTCYWQVGLVTSDLTIITMNLGWVVIPQPSGTWANITLKVTAAKTVNPQGQKFERIPIRIHDAWIKSSTESTVGRLKKVDATPEPYYLGVGSLELGQEILKGLLVDGLIIGLQESPGKFDIVFRVEEPPSDELKIRFGQCLAQFENDLIGDE